MNHCYRATHNQGLTGLLEQGLLLELQHMGQPPPVWAILKARLQPAREDVL